MHQGVYAVAGLPPAWLTAVWAALLAGGEGAVVSHQTALLLHGLSDRLVPRQPVTITARHGAHMHLAGAVVHQSRGLPPRHVVRHRSGLVVTTPPRAIVDVAAVVGVRHLGVLVGEVVVGRIASLAQISCCLLDVARRGKAGVGALGEVLDDRQPGYVPPHSELERKLYAVLAEGGLPAPKRQVPLPGRGAIEGVVDSAYPDVKVVVEADRRRWHTRVRDLASDHQRDAEAAASRVADPPSALRADRRRPRGNVRDPARREGSEAGRPRGRGVKRGSVCGRGG
jgi:hypothetical protein